jgi:hypothetical protein
MRPRTVPEHAGKAARRKFEPLDTLEEIRRAQC